MLAPLHMTITMFAGVIAEGGDLLFVLQSSASNGSCPQITNNVLPLSFCYLQSHYQCTRE